MRRNPLSALKMPGWHKPSAFKYNSLCGILVLAMILYGCTGGTGSGNSESVFGTDLSSVANFSTEPAELNIPIFYIKRSVPSDPSNLENPYAFNPGAQLYARTSASSSSPEMNITARIFGDNLTYDVKDLEISSDGNTVLFSMHPPEPDPDTDPKTWSIWQISIADISNETVLPTDLLANYSAIAGEGDDFNASYLPEPATGETAIVFSSTRQTENRRILQDEFKGQFSGLTEDSARNERDLADGAIHTASLHVYDSVIEATSVINSVKQITFNQSHDLDPLVMSTGDILFTRWDNISNNNAFSLYKTTPHGTQTELIYGYHSHDTSGSAGGEGIIAPLQILDNNRLLGLLRESELTAPNKLGGALVELDIDNYVDRNVPTFSNAGLLNPAFDLISDSNVITDDGISIGGRFRSAVKLEDNTNRILVSWSPCFINNNGIINNCESSSDPNLIVPFYGIWLLSKNNSESTLRPVIVGEIGVIYSDIVIAETKQTPAIVLAPSPNLEDSDENQRAVLNIKSIYDVDGSDTAPGGITVLRDPGVTDPSIIQAKFLRLVKAVSIPDENVHPFSNTAFGISSNQLMREIVGYLPIEPDGSVRGIVPANIPLMIDLVDIDGKRISGRHENWITLGPNEVFECIGCHTSNSTAPHGRINAQPPSVNPGAILPGIFPNTVLFAGNPGLTMAESYAQFLLTPPVGEPQERQPQSSLSYIDEWTDDSGSLTKAPSINIDYTNLTTTNPEVAGGCRPTWTPLCRIVINYEDHIQPIWEATRTPVSDGAAIPTMIDSCVGCHTTAADRIPAGQLDLTSTPSDINDDHFTSYRELLQNDIEQSLAGTTLVNREYQCENGLDIDNNPIIQNFTPAIGRTMSQNGAASSARFFDCLTNDNLDNTICRDNITLLPDTTIPPSPDLTNCMELGGNPVTTEPVINHNDMLSPEELRLIAEWLDLGAQYYNNPLDAPNP